jgi:cytochrome c-type biogenesis protein CcsB
MNILEAENLAVSVTFWSSLAAMAVFVLQLGLDKPRLKWVGNLGLAVALVGSGVTLGIRAVIAQHAPWSNLWESMITVLFGSLVFYFIAEFWYKPRNFGVVAAPLVVLLIGGASILPPNFKGAAPLMPALQSYWIKIHVLIMLFSYAAFTMSFAAAVAYFVVAWRQGRLGTPEVAAAVPTDSRIELAELVGAPETFLADAPTSAATMGPTFVSPATYTSHTAAVAMAESPMAATATPLIIKPPSTTTASAEAIARSSASTPQDDVSRQLAFFDELTYRLILMGFPLLMIGIITGAMWANGAWGTYWSWDPKETWALITWFVYAAYLHARISRDWTGNKAAGLAVLGFFSMVVTYIGVNYLSHGLHSYGFLR